MPFDVEVVRPRPERLELTAQELLHADLVGHGVVAAVGTGSVEADRRVGGVERPRETLEVAPVGAGTIDTAPWAAIRPRSASATGPTSTTRCGWRPISAAPTARRVEVLEPVLCRGQVVDARGTALSGIAGSVSLTRRRTPSRCCYRVAAGRAASRFRSDLSRRSPRRCRCCRRVCTTRPAASSGALPPGLGSERWSTRCRSQCAAKGSLVGSVWSRCRPQRIQMV